jgi:putative transposase
VQGWIGAVRAKTAYIERGSPWENGLHRELQRPASRRTDGEIFYSLAEARIVIESWRRHYNTERPHASLGYKPPAPEVFIPAVAARAASQPRPATLPALAEKPTMN